MAPGRINLRRVPQLPQYYHCLFSRGAEKLLARETGWSGLSGSSGLSGWSGSTEQTRQTTRTRGEHCLTVHSPTSLDVEVEAMLI